MARSRRKAPPAPSTAQMLRALGHPLREKLLVYSADHPSLPWSPNMAADSFNVPLPNLAYHVRMLVQLNILKLDHTKPRRGAIEHYYVIASDEVARAVKSLLAAATVPS